MYGRRLLGLILGVVLGAGLLPADKLYLKDGDYQMVREYQVLQDRVRYYSTERSEWEEIPLDMVDLAKTRAEVAEIEAEKKREREERAEETAAVKAARAEVASIPSEPGVYQVIDGKVITFELADSKVVNNKKRSVLKVVSPLMITGKATLELDGDHATREITDPRPEFFLRLAEYEGFGLVKLESTKKGSRIVEHLKTMNIQRERLVDEERDAVPIFKKQEGDMLFRIWPETPLAPGEYALVEYTEGKLNTRVWDFSVR